MNTVLPGREEIRVTTLELFFDLVFVFTLTRLTAMFEHDFTVTGLAKLGLLLAVLWYMYGGYAWLTNSVPPVAWRSRLILLLGMGAFFVVALALPHAFDTDALIFAFGYAAVAVIHAGMFLLTDDPASRRAILKLAPFNLIGPVLLVAGAFAGGTARWVLWVVAALWMWISGTVNSAGGFRIRPAHFVERHDLVLLVAFGESLMAVGIGAAGRHVDAGLVLSALLMLALLGSLWWGHFGSGEEHRAVRTLSHTGAARRGRLVVLAYGWTYLLVLGGVVVLAAGATEAIAHPWEHLHLAPALALGGGVALYLVGDILLRLQLRLGPVGVRLVLAVLALGTVNIGLGVSSMAQLATLAAVLVAGILVEAVRARRGQPQEVGA